MREIVNAAATRRNWWLYAGEATIIRRRRRRRRRREGRSSSTQNAHACLVASSEEWFSEPQSCSVLHFNHLILGLAWLVPGSEKEEAGGTKFSFEAKLGLFVSTWFFTFFSVSMNRGFILQTQRVRACLNEAYCLHFQG
jgi:hypothetical protein